MAQQRTAGAPTPPLTFQVHDHLEPVEGEKDERGFPDRKVPNFLGPAVSAHVGDQRAGFVRWVHDPGYSGDGKIHLIYVRPEFQRKGIGTALYNWTKKNAKPELHHSGELSDDAVAWKAHLDQRTAALQFVRHDVHPDADDDAHAVSAYLGHRPVGRIRWHPDGELHQIEVDPAHRHKHIATDMFNWAQANVEPRLRHSPAMTDEGRQWAASMGYRPQQYTRVPEATGALWRTAMPMPLPDDITFRYHPTNESIPERLDGVMPVLAPAVSAWRGRTPVGTLEWHPGGEISYVYVPIEEQGQSIATGMMDHALKHAPEVHHSENLTTQGRGWSQYEQNRTKKQDDTEAAWAQYEKARRAFRITAMVSDDLLHSLSHEFADWAGRNDRENPTERNLEPHLQRGPIGYWPHVESFMRRYYPAAFRGLHYGFEEVQPLMDDSSKRDHEPYETGPEAHAKYGYDPKEIAAGMLLLHNNSHQGREDFREIDENRLSDIARKRQQMQDAYKQRLVQAFRITAAFELDAGALGPTPPLTFEPYNSAWFNGIMARHGDDGRPVGYFTWNPDTGEADAIHSHEELRRRGIPKAMVHHVLAHPDTYESKEPIHRSDYMSQDGLALARSAPDYDPSKESEFTIFNGNDDSQWGWKPPEWVPLRHPYRGQSEAELAPRLTPGFHSRNAFRLTAAFDLEAADDEWYHASPHDLPPGTVLAPGGGESAFAGMESAEPGAHVWMSSDADGALEWAQTMKMLKGQGHVYRVKPHRSPEIYDEDDPDQGYTADDGATVLERVHTAFRLTAAFDLEAMPTYYHYTDDPDFTLRNQSPRDVEGGGDAAGLFVSPEAQSNFWPYQWGHGRSHMVELHSPHNLEDHPDVINRHFLHPDQKTTPELFVPHGKGDLEVRAVHPIDEWEPPDPFKVSA